MANITNKLRHYENEIVAGAVIATLAGLTFYNAKCQNYFGSAEKKEAQKQEQIQRINDVEKQRMIYAHDLEVKQKATEEARMARRNGNYTEPQVFNNPDGTIDKYFPVEDLLKNSNSWGILYTDKKTKEVQSKNFAMSAGKVKRDLDSNQSPFVELINEEHHWNGGVTYNYTIHLREKDRISGGTESLRNGRNNYTSKIQTIDLENKVEEGK